MKTNDPMEADKVAPIQRDIPWTSINLTPPREVRSVGPKPVSNVNRLGLDTRSRDRPGCQLGDDPIIGEHTRADCPMPVKCGCCGGKHWRENCTERCRLCSRRFAHSSD